MSDEADTKSGLSRPTVWRLQRQQENFDRERGLDFQIGPTAPSVLDRIAFTALALCGEAGELANAVKKAQRARWLGQSDTTHLRQARGELGDVCAYLFKLASLLGVELDEAYLTTLNENALRFASQVDRTGTVITIAGPSGVGKTTVVRGLAREIPDVHAFFETASNNPHLPLLFSAPARFDALANQRWFLNQLDAFVRSADVNTSLLLDQDPAGVVRVYGRVFRDEGLLSSDGYVALLEDLVTMEASLARRCERRIVFLGASAATLRRRAASRGDQRVPPESWFGHVADYFDELRSKSPRSLFVSTEGRAVEEVLDEVREKVRFDPGA